MRGAGRLTGLLALLLFAVACGGGEGADCPYGYVRVDGVCQPPLLVDTGGPRPDGGGTGTDAAPDGAADVPADISGAADGARPDLVADGGPDGGLDPDVPVPPDTPAPTGAVGDPCRRDQDCLGGLVCLGWQSGYCTRLGCDQPGAECPAGSTCLRVEAGATACFRTCDTSGDCRVDDGYACKSLPDEDGAPVPVCHEVVGGAAGVGAGCDGHADCAGELICVSGLPGGACLPLWCLSDADCEAAGVPDGACVRFDGIATCLPGCSGEGDCAAVGDGSLTCGTRRNTAGATVQVCVSGQAGLLLGAACLSDGECDSGTCEMLGDGRCALGSLPCFSEDDCPPAASCQPISPPVTACAAVCGAPGQTCPGGGGCAVSDGGAASCRPSCRWDAGHASHDCRADTGWDCVWGVPLRDEAREGTFCHLRGEGAIGAPCQTAGDCTTSSQSPAPLCLTPAGAPAGTTGYCSRACTPGSCPFGTYCLETAPGGPLRCQRVCNSAADCAPGHACVSGAQYSTCAPE